MLSKVKVQRSNKKRHANYLMDINWAICFRWCLDVVFYRRAATFWGQPYHHPANQGGLETTRTEDRTTSSWLCSSTCYVVKRENPSVFPPRILFGRSPTSAKTKFAKKADFWRLNAHLLHVPKWMHSKEHVHIIIWRFAWRSCRRVAPVWVDISQVPKFKRWLSGFQGAICCWNIYIYTYCTNIYTCIYIYIHVYIHIHIHVFVLCMVQPPKSWHLSNLSWWFWLVSYKWSIRFVSKCI